ncbi:conserved phage C-terminal domain-containing protein [Pandoraea eparura]|nr:conserved phage C-terminal domain-containing protein [Pandoraea eparura]
MYSEFASDPKVQMMSEAMQRRLVMLFCLQCSNGIETFHVTERETSIAFAMRVSEQELAETKDVFMRRGFIDSDWNLLNWSKRQYESDSSTGRVRRYREKQKQQVETNETLQKRSSNALEQNRTDTEQKDMSGKPDASSKPRRSAKPKPEDHPQASEVLDYLNAKAHRSFQPVKANLSMIGARLSEGATVADCKAVIDAKVAQWLNDEKMAEYLRPETLFNATKFAGYRGSLPSPDEPPPDPSKPPPYVVIPEGARWIPGRGVAF